MLYPVSPRPYYNITAVILALILSTDLKQIPLAVQGVCVCVFVSVLDHSFLLKNIFWRKVHRVSCAVMECMCS